MSALYNFQSTPNPRSKTPHSYESRVNKFVDFPSSGGFSTLGPKHLLGSNPRTSRLSPCGLGVSVCEQVSQVPPLNKLAVAQQKAALSQAPLTGILLVQVCR